MRRLITICLVLIFFSTDYASAGDWHTFDICIADHTWVNDIDDISFVGRYNVDGDNYGFYVKGNDFTFLDFIPYGIDGSYIVGGNILYDVTTKTKTILNFGAIAIDDNYIVGDDILYDITTGIETTFDFPGYISGISGNKIVGNTTLGDKGILYDITNGSWTTFHHPDGDNWTEAYCIEGNNIAGTYTDLHTGFPRGFVYDWTTDIWTNIEHPSGGETWIYGIDGNNLVGWYTTDCIHAHGFVYGIGVPEPAMLLLLGIGGLALLRRRRA